MLLGVASFIQGAISPHQQRQLVTEERMWIGMESEMVHEKVPCCWLHLAYIPLFFVLAGLRAGTVLLWAVSIGKKKE